MTDWADVFAEEIVRRLKDGTTDAAIIALQLRALKDTVQTEAIKAATEQIKAVFAEHGVGGGDK